MNSNNKQYLKEVAASLTCPRGVKAIFISQLKSDAKDYVQSNPDATKEDLIREFGSPEEIAAGFFDRNDYSAMLKKSKKRATFRMVTAIVMAVVLVFFACYFVDVVKDMSGSYEISDPIVETNALNSIINFGGLH